MVSFEIFVKSMPPSLSELKVTPSFCFPFKIPDDPTASNKYNTSGSLIFREIHEYEKYDSSEDFTTLCKEKIYSISRHMAERQLQKIDKASTM